LLTASAIDDGLAKGLGKSCRGKVLIIGILECLKMANRCKYKQSDIIDAVKQSENGLPSEVADILECCDATVYNYRNKYPAIQEAFASKKERRKDFVEGELYKQIKRGNIAAIIFYLKTQAKDRGYVERQEVTGAEGSHIVVRLVGDDHD